MTPGRPAIIDRALGAGPSTGTVVCPVGSASAVVSAAWVSVRADGGVRGTVRFHRGADASGADGPPPETGPALVVEARSALRAHAPVPSGTEFLAYDLRCGGPGALCVETAPVRAAPSPVVPATATLLATLDYDRGDLSQWSTLQTRDRNGPPGGYATYSAAVRDGGPGHPSAARFEVRPGDVPDFGGGERSEVRAGSAVDVRAGDERWYSWSMRFGDTAFRPPTGGWCIVMQWHAGSGSPPLCLECTRDGRLALNNNRPGGYSRPLVGIDAGRWHDYVLHVRFARSAAAGLVELWRDGTRLAGYAAATMASDHNYLKQGLYRSSQPFAQVIWHDGLRIFRP